MNRVSLLLLTTVLLIGLPGCVYMHTKAPGQINTTTEYKLTGNDFKVLDRVSVTGETTLWFGMVATGGKGYQDLIKQAKELGGDDIMNYSFDMELKSIFLFIYAKYQWQATGMAVKYTR